MSIRTIIISKFVARWSGNVRFETSSSGIPLNLSCFFRSLTFGWGLQLMPMLNSILEQQQLSPTNTNTCASYQVVNITAYHVNNIGKRPHPGSFFIFFFLPLFFGTFCRGVIGLGTGTTVGWHCMWAPCSLWIMDIGSSSMKLYGSSMDSHFIELWLFVFDNNKSALVSYPSSCGSNFIFLKKIVIYTMRHFVTNHNYLVATMNVADSPTM